MTQCWSEGEMRAYLDRELSSRDMEGAATHIRECAACSELCAELSGRAERLAHWMAALPVLQAPVRIPALRRRVPAGRHWAAGSAGVAAAVALGIALAPRHVEKAAIAPQPLAPPALTAPSPLPASVKPAIILRVPRKREAAPRPKPQIQYYVALDNEPIETGLVVRVGLNGGQIPADVIVGPDGRARAIRLVSDGSGEPK